MEPEPQETSPAVEPPSSEPHQPWIDLVPPEPGVIRGSFWLKDALLAAEDEVGPSVEIIYKDGDPFLAHFDRLLARVAYQGEEGLVEAATRAASEAARVRGTLCPLDTQREWKASDKASLRHARVGIVCQQRGLKNFAVRDLPNGSSEVRIYDRLVSEHALLSRVPSWATAAAVGRAEIRARLREIKEMLNRQQMPRVD